MKDDYGREITGLRISVTQRCNLACFYCHREGQEKNNNELSSDEIEKIARVSREIGIREVKITGGEPLVRRDIVEIVKKISRYMDEVSITTNGVLLSKYAQILKNAGLNRANVSLDSLNHEKYKKITGKDYLQEVINSIKTASKIMLLKINMVVMKGLNEDEITEMIKFVSENRVILQLIELEADKKSMNGDFYKKYHHPLKDIEKELKEKALRIEIRKMHHRKKYFLPVNGEETQVEVVRPMHNSEFCRYCSRMRMTSDGKLKPCLYDNNNVDIASLIRDNVEDDKLIEAFKKAVKLRKPYW
ncbi:MAG TPA: GTP 3',8-cyclase MoaA [Thermoplasmata archaeon]|nr:GTP 3',8-cyclase MoaA [Thermoplasmata archaeon]